MADLEPHLLNDFQRDFPLAPAPFGVIAGRLGVSEAEVLEVLARLQACGKVSRVGAVFRPHSIGSSTLAALAVPMEELDEVAQLVSNYAEVNHNYEREHHYNLWFVVTAASEARILEVLGEIGRRTGYQPLHLPMLEGFHIDLGFDLSRPHRGGGVAILNGASGTAPQPCRALPRSFETALAGAIQQGLPLVPRPFAAIGAGIGLAENEVIAGLAYLLEQGIIKRMGVVVRHHELGYRANAMVVWNIPDEQVSEIGQRIGSFDFVTLCYRRPRRLPDWRYNLFTMIHGRRRDEVLGLVDQLREQCGLENIAYEVLFSCRRFKQCGARYVTSLAAERAGARCAMSASAG
ncbi:MAG: Lrp/AsnC family transcriptional regulator [Nitrosomonadales bacterium]|nr:Lrp/AsnC family transcriptional regulator [Nitrosomonadales bacterium]